MRPNMRCAPTGPHNVKKEQGTPTSEGRPVRTHHRKPSRHRGGFFYATESQET